MKIKKIITLTLTVLCLAATLVSAVSCNNDFNAEGWYEDNEKTKRSAAYTDFNDEKHYAFIVKEPIAISVKITTESGGIGAEIYLKDMPDAPIYSAAIADNAEGVRTLTVSNGGVTDSRPIDGDYTDTVTVNTEGSYILHIKGVNHKGSFLFDW